MNKDDFDPMEYWKKNHPEYYAQILIDRRLIARFDKAKALEKSGDIAGAIQQYELNINDHPTWASVQRLTILYRKVGRYDDEVRLLEMAQGALKDINTEYILDLIAKRLSKARALLAREKS
jgi:tetratricopeptide (TPR) repeat protein